MFAFMSIDTVVGALIREAKYPEKDFAELLRKDFTYANFMANAYRPKNQSEIE
jgi:hypothetical protein